MNCSYRILKDVHIGLRVRKTKDKKTVPFKNDPMTGVKIESWSDQGFQLSHPDLPKKIWVDFYQLPLDKIQLEYGVIKNPITFVEEIMEGGTMVLVRADTLDYMEMIKDKEEKEEAKTYGVKQLVPGDRVISAVCKHGNVMVYLGTFNIATMSSLRDYGYGYTSRETKIYSYINSTPERAYFAYEKENGGYSIQSYPVQNKIVKENYLASDKGRGNRLDPAFTDENKNMQMILDINLATDRSYWVKYKDEAKLIETKRAYKDIVLNDYDDVFYIQKSKINIRENAMDFVRNTELANVNKNLFYINESEAQTKRSRR
jgi:hypothetical protein